MAGQAISAEDDAELCKKLVLDSCTGCHVKDRFCVRLGDSKKSWKSLIKFMISMGADLGKEEVEQLSDCLSIPSLGAKAACADVLNEDQKK